jgi:Fe-S cluster biogenesis protein NfuA
VDEVERVIDTWVRPLIEADGGSIEVVGVDDDVVTVRLTRACGGCPGAPMTRSGLIEPALTRALGRAIRVKLQRAANPESA